MCVRGLEPRTAASRRAKWHRHPFVRATVHVVCVNDRVQEISALMACYFRIDVSGQPMVPYMVKVRLPLNVGKKLPPLAL